MKAFVIFAAGAAAAALAIGAPGARSRAQSHTRPTLATEADFRRAMTELSNAGRWGPTDDKGTANFITPAKRKQAAALVKVAFEFLEQGWRAAERVQAESAETLP